MAECLGCPVVSLRFGNGLVFGLFYDEAQPPAIARDSVPLGTLVTLDPGTDTPTQTEGSRQLTSGGRSMIVTTGLFFGRRSTETKPAASSASKARYLARREMPKSFSRA